MAPDEDDYKIHGSNPEWHGLYRDFTDPGNHDFCNYISSYEVQTRVALKGGKANTITNKRGLNNWAFNKLIGELYQKGKGDMFGSKKLSSVLGSSNTFTNRKHFLYGAAIHNLTDSLAHSSCIYVNGHYEKMRHSRNGKKECDIVEEQLGRYEIAKLLAEYAIIHVKNDLSGDYLNFFCAFDTLYEPSSNNKYGFKLGYLRLYAKNNCEASGVLFTQLNEEVFGQASCKPVVDEDWNK